MDRIASFLENLGIEGVELEKRRRLPTDEFVRRFHRWKRNILQVMQHAGLEAYEEEVRSLFETSTSFYGMIPEVNGLVMSAHDQLRAGFLGRVKLMIHADLYSSIVEQARALNDKGFQVAAAVLGRIAVEGWLKDRAEQAQVELSSRMSASVVNEKLKAAGVFAVPKWSEVQSVLAVGNAAAHGDVASITAMDVERLLKFVEDNAAELSATVTNLAANVINPSE